MSERLINQAFIKSLLAENSFINARAHGGRLVKLPIDPVDRYAWRTKFYTINCRSCPFYIGQDQAISVIKTVANHIRISNRGWKSPENPQGVCIYKLDQPWILKETKDPDNCKCLTK